MNLRYDCIAFDDYNYLCKELIILSYAVVIRILLTIALHQLHDKRLNQMMRNMPYWSQVTLRWRISMRS